MGIRENEKGAGGERSVPADRRVFVAQKELEENRRRVLEEYRDGVSADGRNIDAMDWVYSYYDDILSSHKKESTAKDIRREIDNYINPYLKDKQLKAVTFLDIQRIVTGLEGRSRSMYINVLGVLRHSFAAAVAQGLIDKDPTAAVKPKLPKQKRNRAFTDEERAIIEELLSERSKEPLLLGLLYFTGMRRGEVLGLQWRDVDFADNVIHVRRDFDYRLRAVDGLKTTNARRDIPLVPALREILSESRGVGKAFVVSAPTDPGKALPESTYRRKWNTIREAIAPDVTARTFRDNFATVMYDAGVDVLTAAKAMGHASPTTTLNIYTDIERSRKVQRGADAIRGAFSSTYIEKVAKKLPSDTEI